MITNLMKFNYGQHMLFSYLCISIEGRKGSELDKDDLNGIIKLIRELTKIEHYGTIEDCPDYLIMVQPEKSYEIFCDFWDENQTYFEELY